MAARGELCGCNSSALKSENTKEIKPMKHLLLTTSLIAAAAVPAYAGTETNLSGAASADAEMSAPAADVSGEATAMGDAKAETAPLQPGSEPAAAGDANAGADSSTSLNTTLSADADAPAMEPLDLQEMSAETLTGAPAYDAQDEHIGEVSDVIVNTSGGIEAVIVDVGGFLGLGEKPVELPMSDVEIQKADDDIRVTAGMTHEELENLPEYQGS